MTKRMILYARVSDPNIQDTKNSASIDQQLATQRELCERNGWQIIGEFVDREYYKATQPPKKGKMVNPSGERADRPELIKMLEVVKTGDADAVLCWRDDRLVRHPRVAVVLEDALDIGDRQRNGKPKIEIRDATGAMIDRFTLSIKATIWREENKRRGERTRMGKVATLQRGRWPGSYERFGYKTRTDGGRGRIIEIDEDEAVVVRKIHETFDAGVSVLGIRRGLVESNARQKGKRRRLHVWPRAMVTRILRAEDYAGVATWRFGDGKEISIEIPAIVDRDLWERNQERLERNKTLSPRNAGGVYLLQGLIRCGDCGSVMFVHRKRYGYVGKKREFPVPLHHYICKSAVAYPEEEHQRPFRRYGPTLDWVVWRRIVDYGIKRPDLIQEQVLSRRAELLAQGDGLEGDVAQVQRKLEEVDAERAFYQRQAARGKMTEIEFDQRMKETEDARTYWGTEIERLQELRDDQVKVQTGLDYATKLLSKISLVLPEIDIPPKELRRLPKERREEILTQRRDIVRALVNCVRVYADGQIEIEGLVDGSEAAQFELPDCSTLCFGV